MFTDSHAHLTSAEMLPDIDQSLDRARQAGVNKIINICTDKETLLEGVKLQKKHPKMVYNTGATTPHDVEKEGKALFPLFEKHAREGKLVAIGESGLDYHYEHSNRDLQKHFFKRYMKLALELDLALVIHCRDAFSDLFKMANEFYPSSKAILHCFTGTLDEAKQVLDRGWFISFSGILTFKRSEELRQVAAKIPFEQVLIETDAPYLAPQSKRGKRNESMFVTETAAKLAEIRGCSVEYIASRTSENAARIFQL